MGFLRHEPCPHCGSSDAYSVYSDGGGYCFSCQTADRPGAKKVTTPKARAGGTNGPLISDAKYLAIPPRKIVKKTCEKYGYGIATLPGGEKVHVAPYYQDRRLVAQHLRTANKDFPWRGDPRNVQLFGQHLYPPGGRRIVVTEGEIDAMSVAQAMSFKCPAVSVPGGAQGAKKAILRNLEYLTKFDKVILALDGDEPGRAAIAEVAPLLQPGKVFVVEYPAGIKDANDFLQAGQAAELVNAIYAATPWRPDGIIAGTDVWDRFISEPEQGLSIPYPQLNAKLDGLKPRRLYMITAGSGIGKSTFSKELVYTLLTEHQQKVGVVALEESTRRTAEGLVGIYLNRPLHLSRKGVTQEKLREGFDATVGSGRCWLYDHWGSLDVDHLLGKLRYMVIGCGVQWILLDHISIVVSGIDAGNEGERKMIDRLMTALRSLIEETGVSIIGIVHLKRPKEGKGFNEGRQVSLSDLRGSASLEQLSDVVLAIERDQQAPEAGKADRSLLRVLKNRDTGQVGPCGYITYNAKTGRMRVAEAEAFTGDIEPPPF